MRTIFGLVIVFFMGCQLSFAQKATSPKAPACRDAKVHGKLVSIDKEWEDKKYKLVYFNSENIPSKAMIPFKIDVVQGETYQVNYVVGAHASKYQLDVVDNNVKNVVREKGKGDKQNIAVVSKQFTAATTGVYMVVFSQQTKEDNCVAISVLKK
ncbi:hypothetical protein [Taibaiella sp. KBW10]|uniref:hypothetical protein n=1 Tax=Taibaiella sp. KBW10 TaxID=2153357 RepID=UPI000F599A9B|nr:hypothetical protein [Taibaiella sp. KBW10]